MNSNAIGFGGILMCRSPNVFRTFNRIYLPFLATRSIAYASQYLRHR